MATRRRLRTLPFWLVVLVLFAVAIWLNRQGDLVGERLDERGRAVWREEAAIACFATLGDRLPAGMERSLPIVSGGGCGLDQPLSVRMLDIPLSSASGGGRRVSVSLGASLPMSCPMAEAVRAWLMESVQPAAEAHFRQPVRALRTLGSYACRPIAGSSALSEHSFANALDVAGFVLRDGREITLLRDWDGAPAPRAFLRDVRDGGCRAFRTVLSPDYNDAHRDHFHFDMARRPFGIVCR
jgi:hypothetical protein